MRYPASEKLEIIRLVEQSHLGVGSTLDKLGIPKTTFYRWYDRFLAFGDAGLEDRNSSEGIVKLTDCKPSSAFLHEAKSLNLCRTASTIYREFGVNLVNLTQPPASPRPCNAEATRRNHLTPDHRSWPRKFITCCAKSDCLNSVSTSAQISVNAFCRCDGATCSKWRIASRNFSRVNSSTSSRVWPV